MSTALACVCTVRSVLIYACNGRTRRGASSGGNESGSREKKKTKPKEKKTPKHTKAEPKHKDKVPSKAQVDSDSDNSLGSGSDEEIDAAALMRKYGLDPDDGVHDQLGLCQL